MPVKTSNAFGDITITDEAIAVVAGYTALDCYGVVDLVNKKVSDNFPDLFNHQSLSRGIKLTTLGNRITINLSVILKYGVSINAVADSLKKSVKYSVEKFTGMIVDAVNVQVIGVRV